MSFGYTLQLRGTSYDEFSGLFLRPFTAICDLVQNIDTNHGLC